MRRLMGLAVLVLALGGAASPAPAAAPQRYTDEFVFSDTIDCSQFNPAWTFNDDFVDFFDLPAARSGPLFELETGEPLVLAGPGPRRRRGLLPRRGALTSRSWLAVARGWVIVGQSPGWLRWIAKPGRRLPVAVRLRTSIWVTNSEMAGDRSRTRSLIPPQRARIWVGQRVKSG